MAALRASHLITRALRLLGVLSASDPLDDDLIAESLDPLNEMLDSWNTERLYVFTVQELKPGGNFPTLGAGVQTRTIGPTGQIVVAERPVKLTDYVYVVYNSVSYPVKLISQEQWTTVTLKALTSTLPQYAYYDAAYPNAKLTFWPVGSVDLELHIPVWTPFSSFATVQTQVSLPQGYARAIIYSLAEELAGPMGRAIPPSIANIARMARANIKTINKVSPVLGFRAGLTGNPGTFNIYTGE